MRTFEMIAAYKRKLKQKQAKEKEAKEKRQSASLKALLPRMNQLALLYDMKLSNPKHFKLLKFVVEVEQI